MEMRTLALGLAHFVDKYGYQAEVYARHGASIRFVTMDISGMSVECAKKYDASIVLVGSRIWARLYVTVRQILVYKPTHIEIYDIGRLTIVYALLAKAFFRHLTIYLIGGELNDRHQSELFTTSGWRIKQFLLKLSLLLADLVIAKEEHMRAKLKQYGIDARKIHFIGNAVPFPEKVRRHLCVDFLYLNAVIRQRHVDVMVSALELLHRDGVQCSARIVGFSTLDQGMHLRDPVEEQRILAMISELDARPGLELLGFTKQPFEHYEQARFFILPGEVIYANYALLEAMSYGVIPSSTLGREWKESWMMV